MKKYLLMTCGLLVVSACGANTTTLGAVIAAENANVGTNAANAFVVRSGGMITHIGVGGSSLPVTSQGFVESSGFEYFYGQTGSSSADALDAETTSGAGTVVAFINEFVAPDANGGMLSRIGNTTISSNSATYSGTSASMHLDANYDLIAVYTGNTSLDVNFASGTATGGITGRHIMGTMTAGEDISLSGSYASGAFTGTSTATGMSNGTFDGLIVGASGNEVVGTFGLDVGTGHLRGGFIGAE